MIAKVAAVIMTLLSADVKPIENRDSVHSAAASSLLEQKDEWNVRPYCPKRDRKDLEEICRNTFGGSDYLPKMAATYADDPNSHFQALIHSNDAKNSRLAAVANMRMVNQKTGWLEGVRTSEDYRNKGLAFRLLQSLLKDAGAMNYEQVLSCTVESNVAMRRVFEKLQLKELTQIQMIKFDALRSLTGWNANDAQPCQHLIDSLDIEHLISKSARESKWSVIESKAQLEKILDTIRARGGCGLMPGLYEVIDGHCLQDCMAEQLVLSLEDEAVMVLLRDKRISTLKSNWSLCLAGTHDKHLQSALWHACSPELQSKLTRGMGERTTGFTVAFDGAIPTNGALCSALPLTDDTCFVYGTRLSDPEM